VGEDAAQAGCVRVRGLRGRDPRPHARLHHEERSDQGDGRETEDRDIRATILSTSDALRSELGKLDDRLVASNQDIGAQINKMRDDLVATMKDGDARLERRFDKLDEKFDTLLTKIDYEVIEIPWNQAPLTVRADGVLVNEDGKEIGTLPAVIQLDQP
jgi:hypothetical protein